MSRHTCAIHPSILSADFLRLGEELQACLLYTSDAADE